MTRLLLVPRLDCQSVRAVLPEARFVALRRLRARETAFARTSRLLPLYRPSLTAARVSRFFEEFDRFWDAVVAPFGAGSPFWRNAVSSKMQEWERSSSHLLLTLFALIESGPAPVVVIVCGSQERRFCEAFARLQGWRVSSAPRGWAAARASNFLANASGLATSTLTAAAQSWQTRQRGGLPPPPRVLVASLFYGRSVKNGVYTDPFFGDAHARFAASGQSTVYLTTPLEAGARPPARSERTLAVVTPQAVAGAFGVVAAAAKVALRRLPIPDAPFMGVNAAPLLRAASRSFVQGFSVHAEYLHDSLARVTSSGTFDRLVINYEGNAFERAAIQAFRATAAAPVVAYSQGVSFPANLKLRMTPAEHGRRPEPDQYISTGPLARRRLLEVGQVRQAGRVSTGCALRALPDPVRPDRRRASWVLVALDGVWGTAVFLDWVFEHHAAFGGRRVKVRAHPSVPWEALLRRCVGTPPAGIEPSVDRLEDEIAGASCVVYRHSSVGLQGLMLGVPAIHARVDSPLPCDPVEPSIPGHRSIASAPELSKALDDLGAGPVFVSEEGRRAAAEYFAPPSPDMFSAFLGRSGAAE